MTELHRADPDNSDDSGEETGEVEAETAPAPAGGVE